MQCQQATFDTDRSYVTVRKYDIQLYDITDRRNQNLLTKQVLSKKHITPYGLDAQNSNIPGAIPPKMAENLSEIRPNCNSKFHADQ